MSPSNIRNGQAQMSPSSVISNDLTIIGQAITIVSQGHVQIDGAVQGNVHGKQVSIGQNGAITGTVMAETVEIRGQLQGAVRSPTVVLHPTARVEGDIHHHNISIAEGAEFDGSVRRSATPADLTPVLDPAAIAAQSDLPPPAHVQIAGVSTSTSPTPPYAASNAVPQPQGGIAPVASPGTGTVSNVPKPALSNTTSSTTTNKS